MAFIKKNTERVPMLVVIIIITFAAYDSYARLGVANSERIVCQITSDALQKYIFFFNKQSSA